MIDEHWWSLDDGRSPTCTLSERWDWKECIFNGTMQACHDEWNTNHLWHATTVRLVKNMNKCIITHAMMGVVHDDDGAMIGGDRSLDISQQIKNVLGGGGGGGGVSWGVVWAQRRVAISTTMR